MAWAEAVTGTATAVVATVSASSPRRIVTLGPLLLGRHAERLVAAAARLTAEILHDGLGGGGVVGLGRVTQLRRPGLEILGGAVELGLALPDLRLGGRLVGVERALGEQRRDLLGGRGELLGIRHQRLDLTGLGLVLDV